MLARARVSFCVFVVVLSLCSRVDRANASDTTSHDDLAIRTTRTNFFKSRPVRLRMIVVGASVVVGLLGVWAAGQLQAKYDSGFDPYNQNVVRMNGMTEVRRHIGDAQQSVASGRAGIANREIQLALEDYLNVKDGLRGTLPADSDPEQVLRGALENRNKGQRAQLLGQADEASRNARESFANNARVISGIQRSDLTISKYARWVGIFGFAGAAGAVVESGVRFVRGRRNDNNRQGRWRGPNLRGLASRDRRKRPKR